MMRYSLLFNRRVALIIALLLSQIEITYGREIKEQQLAKDEAYILVRRHNFSNFHLGRKNTWKQINIPANQEVLHLFFRSLLYFFFGESENYNLIRCLDGTEIHPGRPGTQF